MTFLEYVCELLLGPATSRPGNGESTWPCPRCGHPRWHTRPHRPPHRDRFSCWSCGWWGDEADLVRHFWPRETYPDHQQRLAAWRTDYDASFLPGAGKSPPARPRLGPGPQAELDDTASVELAYRGLSADERITLADAVSLARARGIKLEALAYYCWHSVREAVKRVEQKRQQEDRQRQRMERIRNAINTNAANRNGRRKP